MRKWLFRLLSILLAAIILLPGAPRAAAAEGVPDLSGYIRDSESRHYVQAMLSYHLRENTAVVQALEEGYSALFFFEGCSDNMQDPELSDISYYRVSAVCIAIRLNSAGQPEVIYFNDNCSTLPDRPLAYGAWELEEVGEVGPATICDGTYPLYSVYHAGAYEALHMRTSFEDETVAAVYMTPEGFVTSRATYINIHTRTVNHILQEAMWSAGCVLVGYNDFDNFAQLIRDTYYASYDLFLVEQPVGTVTVNRFRLREQLYDLYENREAVDLLLTSSRCEDPAIYLERCGQVQPLPEAKTVQAVAHTTVMSLPCENPVDARSICLTELAPEDRIDICGSIVNTEGEIWYEVKLFNENGYIPAEMVEDVPPTLWERIVDFFRS